MMQKFNDYNVFKCDRNNQLTNKFQGGEVLIAVRKKYSSVRIVPKRADIEQCFIGIDIHNYKIISLALVIFLLVVMLYYMKNIVTPQLIY